MKPIVDLRDQSAALNCYGHCVLVKRGDIVQFVHGKNGRSWVTPNQIVTVGSSNGSEAQPLRSGLENAGSEFVLRRGFGKHPPSAAHRILIIANRGRVRCARIGIGQSFGGCLRRALATYSGRIWCRRVEVFTV